MAYEKCFIDTKIRGRSNYMQMIIDTENRSSLTTQKKLDMLALQKDVKGLLDESTFSLTLDLKFNTVRHSCLYFLTGQSYGHGDHQRFLEWQDVFFFLSQW